MQSKKEMRERFYCACFSQVDLVQWDKIYYLDNNKILMPVKLFSTFKCNQCNLRKLMPNNQISILHLYQLEESAFIKVLKGIRFKYETSAMIHHKIDYNILSKNYTSRYIVI